MNDLTWQEMKQDMNAYLYFKTSPIVYRNTKFVFLESQVESGVAPFQFYIYSYWSTCPDNSTSLSHTFDSIYYKSILWKSCCAHWSETDLVQY